MTYQVAYAVLNRDQHTLSTKEIDSLMARLLKEKSQSAVTVKVVEAGKQSAGLFVEQNIPFEHLHAEALKSKVCAEMKYIPFAHLKGIDRE